MSRLPIRPRWLAGVWFLAALALMAGRAWIALELPPAGPSALAATLLGVKLAGWLDPIIAAYRHRAGGLGVAVIWEWLPALLFAGGIWWWVRSDPTPWRLPRLREPQRLWLAGLWLLAVASALALVGFGGYPHVQDSIAQQFQAKLFARGRAWAPVPAGGEFFQFEFLVQDGGRWYSQYPPGQAALLALGELTGVPWLVNPLLGALSGVLVYLAGRRIYGAATARLALLLYSLSPFVWFMSAERMNHAGALFWITLGLHALAPTLASRGRDLTARRWAAAGLAFGLAASTRPLCAAAVFLPLAAGALWNLSRGGASRPRLLADLIALGVGLAAGVLPLLLFNWATTGSPLLFGYDVQWGSSGWGFGESQWGPPHTPARAMRHLVTNWDAAGKYLFEWPVPSLLPLLGLALIRRRPLADWILGAVPVAVSLAYFPYFFQDLCLGPRFLYAAIPALVLLSARGLRGAGLAWARRRRLPARRGLALLGQAAALCAAVGLAANLPLLLRWYGNSFWGTSDALVLAVRRAGLHRAVVFVQDFNRARTAALRRSGVSWKVAHGSIALLDPTWIDRQIETGGDVEARLSAALTAHPVRHGRRFAPWLDPQGRSANLADGFWANTPWPGEQDVIYALDLGDRSERLLRDYPGRSAWLWTYDPRVAGFHLQPHSAFGVGRSGEGVRPEHPTPVRSPRGSSAPAAPGTASEARPGTSRRRS